jgi:hypothetical protein
MRSVSFQSVRVLLVAIVAASFCASAGNARITRHWTWDDLYAESDFVGIVVPVANEPVDEKLTLKLVHGQLTLPAVNTRFRVEMALKHPSSEPLKEVTVLHFSETFESLEVANGPSLVNFPVGPVEYEKKTLKDKKVIAEIHMGKTDPLYLAFLKRRADGRYEPTSGQEDADEAFRELHIAISSQP